MSEITDTCLCGVGFSRKMNSPQFGYIYPTLVAVPKGSELLNNSFLAVSMNQKTASLTLGEAND